MNRKILIIFFIIIFIFIIFLVGLLFKQEIELKIDEIKINLNPNKKVELVFITDKNYVNYLRVAIKSAIVNKNKDSIYNISILCVDLSDDEIAQIEKLNEDDVKINTIPLSLDLIKNIQFNPDKIISANKTDFFKFLLPEILKDYDKALFFDSDIIIQKDILKLYNIDLSDKYAGWVALPFIKISSPPKKIIGNFYRHFKYYEYNNGVMLLNLKKMREDEIAKKLIDEKLKEPENTDTHFIHNKIIPHYKTKSLSPVNNLLMKYYEKNVQNFNFFKSVHYLYIRKYETMDDLVKDTVIIHYNYLPKPWQDKTTPLADLWWKYAKMVDENWEVEKIE